MFWECNNKLKPNKLKPELGEFTELKGTKDMVFMTLNWFTTIEILYRPKTVKLKVTVTNRETREKKVTIEKQFPIDQPNLLEEIVNLL